MTRLHNRLSALVLAVTSAVVLTLTPVQVHAMPTSVPAAAVDEPGCDRPLLAEPRRAATVEAASPAKFTAAAGRNDETRADFADLAEDRTLWLDECGKSFYVEPVSAASAEEQGETQVADGAAVANPTAVLPDAVDPLGLQSRPGSQRTIYLDFDGEYVTGSAWNDSEERTTIIAEPYSSTAPADTNFSANEQNAIYRAWLTVAEDFAPFDVNVTTKDPGGAALDRADPSDEVYGTRVIITSGGVRQDECRCGGIAYLDVFDIPEDHAYYQPAWVYTDGSGTSGWNIGRVTSHEVGHNFGLGHDGQGTAAYYAGTNSWAPIMGSGYYGLLGQWSQGSYDGATNTQDDLAIIALGAPLLGDDHGDTIAAATAVDAYAPVQGRITTRTERDAFTFSASGPTSFSVTPATPDTNLDLDLTVLDSSGDVIDSVNPEIYGDEWLYPVPDGLLATWTATLPATRQTYTVLVDGSDNQGRVPDQPYDDYGSLGHYQVTLDTTAGPGEPDPLSATLVEDIAAIVGEPVDAQPVTATGGTAPYTWSADYLPSGLSVDPSTGSITGTVSYETWSMSYFTVWVTDAAGASRSVEVGYTAQYPETLTVYNETFEASVGAPFWGWLFADGNQSNPTWQVVAGALPPGIRLTSDGLVAGTPTVSGDFTATVQASTTQSTATGTLTIRVAPVPAPPTPVPPPTTTTPPPPVPPTTTLPPLPAPIAFATTSLPKAKAKRAYKATVALANPTPGLAWKITKGDLPKGVKMKPSADSSKVTLTGKPKKKGIFKFTLRVQEVDGDTLVRTFKIKVA